MTGKSRAAAKQKGDDLPCRVSAIDHRKREQCAANRTDKRMQSVPYRIEPRDLVREKFGHCAECAESQHPWVGKHIQHLQIFRQRHDVEMHRKARGENRQVKTPAG